MKGGYGKYTLLKLKIIFNLKFFNFGEMNAKISFFFLMNYKYDIKIQMILLENFFSIFFWHMWHEKIPNFN